MAEVIPQDRWAQIETVFLAASDHPAAERAAYVTTACGGDTELEAEVLSLLGHDLGETPALLEALEVGAANVVHDDALEGTRLGPYLVGRELGRGGTSVVYLAMRADGEFQKQVAIKLIKRGMDTTAVIARLRLERRILASLEHPGIARLLDGGTTRAGLPWIVMEYIEGVPIHRYCQENRLDIESRCRLLAAVAEAVAYAHRHLVVHRDLKPSNILVGADGAPKLLDFGIAKLLTGDTEGSEPVTAMSQRPFTPGYASPEQLVGGVIGTASDVYSLGVVAFELLTGVKPGADTERASVAARRAGRDPRWARRLEGDLDVILETALRVRPERRYHSVEQLGGDLRRHLAGLPVTARKETVRYRCGKFLGRHRWGTAAATLLIAAGAAGAALYVHQARVAAKRFDDLHHFANSFLFDVDDQLRLLPDSTQARAVMVEKAIGYLNGLALQRRGDRGLQLDAGNAWRRVGDAQGSPVTSSLGDTAGARASYERSIALLEPLAKAETEPRHAGDARGALAESYAHLADMERVAGDSGRAVTLIQQAVTWARPSKTPPDPEMQAELGQILVTEAWVMYKRGRGAEQEQAATEAMQLLRPAATRDPEYRTDLADTLSLLGQRKADTGQTADGLTLFRENLRLRQQLAAENPHDRGAQRNLILAWSKIPDVELSLRVAGAPGFDAASVIEDFRQAHKVAAQMVASDPSDTTARTDLAVTTQRVADGYFYAGRQQEALQAYLEAAPQFEALLKADPDNHFAIFYLIDIDLQIGIEYFATGDPTQAAAIWQRGLAISEHAVQKDPNDSLIRSIRLLLWRRLGRLSPPPEGSWRRQDVAIHLERELAGFAPLANTIRRKVTVAECWDTAGDCYRSVGDVEDARRCYRNSMAAWKLVTPVPAANATEPADTQRKLDSLPGGERGGAGAEAKVRG